MTPDTPAKSELATYLESYQHQRRLSDVGLSAFLGISPRTWGRLRDGHNIQARILVRIAHALKLPLEQVFRMAGKLPQEGETDQEVKVHPALLPLVTFVNEIEDVEERDLTAEMLATSLERLLETVRELRRHARVNS